VRVHVLQDYESLSRRAADLVSDLLASKPDAAVVIATGNTPMGAYRELAARRYRPDASRLRVFQLDEYLGVPFEDRRSLRRWMHECFVEPLGVPPENVVGLDGEADDPEAACSAYEAVVAEAGGFDLAVLGLGPNGHLGFNEPPSGPEAPTRVVDLSEESILSNARYWGGEESVPRRAMTAGMDLLLGARRTLLLVSGAGKRGILRRVVEGPASPEVPASFLRRMDTVTVLADRAAWPFDWEPDGEALPDAPE
jgi:glucosamine-6-phosphate deaminase